MSDRPVIIYPVTPSGELLVKESDGTCLAFNPQRHGTQSYDLILPGQMVGAHRHELPKLREREKLAAARFAIEEHTAAAPEAQHIAMSSDSQFPRLSVIEADYLTSVLDDLKRREIVIGEIYADFDWVKLSESPIKLEDRIIFTGETGYTIDPHWADADLSALPTTDWSALSGRANPPSLRQGAFSKGGSFALPTRQLLKIAAVLCVTGVSWLALQWSEARAISAQAKDLKRLTAQAYTEATGQPAPANPALAVTRAIKNGSQSGPEFLSVLSQLNIALSRADSISVQSLDFNPETGDLTLRLIYPSFESASAFETAARQTGAVFKTGGVRERNNRLIGEGVFSQGGAS